MATISSLSKEYIIIPVETAPGGESINTGVASVEFAFPRVGEPTTWYNGEWQTVGQKTYARVLIGPGSTVGTLTDGSYVVWLRVTQSPEVVVRPAGLLKVT